ncbi:MAG TPA: class I SAM-dependent methyltransferase [bacterium]|nr:class I SAM-dependent methyltransferase [bacterium]
MFSKSSDQVRYWIVAAVLVALTGAVYQAVSIRFLTYVFPFRMLFAISLISALAVFFSGLGALAARRLSGRDRLLFALMVPVFPLSAVCINLADAIPFLVENPVLAAILFTAPALLIGGALSGLCYQEVARIDRARLKQLIAWSAVAFFVGYLSSVYLFTLIGVWTVLVAASLLLLLPLVYGRPLLSGALLAVVTLTPLLGTEDMFFRLFAREPYLWVKGAGHEKQVMGFWSPYARLDFYEMADGRLAGLYNRAQQWAAGDPAYDVAIRRTIYRDITGEVLVVGSGGGYGLLSLTQASSITAIEIDPGVVAAMKGPLARYNRNIYNTVQQVFAGDGRAYLDRTDRQFDFIIFEAADLSYTTTPHSFISIENYLYTEEGIAQALRHLKPDGVFLILVTKELIPAPKFINALPDGVQWRLFEGQLEVVTSIPMNFDFILASHSAEKIAWWEERLKDPQFQMKAVSSSEFHRKSSFGLDPITDNRPLLYFKGWRQAIPFFILLFILTGTLAFTTIRAPRRKEALFFSLLGVAFMITELYIINSMRAYLGGYLETSAFLLGTLVLGTAVGTLAHDRITDKRAAAGLLIALPLMMLMLYYAPLTWAAPLKVLWILAALAPASILMGTLFPKALLRSHDVETARYYAIDTIGASLGLVLFYLLMLAGGFSLIAVAAVALYSASLYVLTTIR